MRKINFFAADGVNFIIGVVFVSMGFFTLKTGQIKNMTLGDERWLPATVAIAFGAWLLFKSLRSIKKRR